MFIDGKVTNFINILGRTLIKLGKLNEALEACDIAI